MGRGGAGCGFLRNRRPPAVIAGLLQSDMDAGKPPGMGAGRGAAVLYGRIEAADSGIERETGGRDSSTGDGH